MIAIIRQVFFVVLSEGKLMEKLSYLFNDFANSRTRLLSRRSLSAMLRYTMRQFNYFRSEVHFNLQCTYTLYILFVYLTNLALTPLQVTGPISRIFAREYQLRIFLGRSSSGSVFCYVQWRFHWCNRRTIQGMDVP